MTQSPVVSERPLRLAAVMPVARPTPVAPLPAESLESSTAGRPPRHDHGEPHHRHHLGPADNRGIITTAKQQVNHAECVVAHQTGRGLEPRSSLPAQVPAVPQAAVCGGRPWGMSGA